ncbi:CopD family protein, partial [Leclercia adecarboxylata]|uniref:CopD family protein n=1 Tax=Leclercia adecarboxylata TaxID=83655 RepID=UPI00234D4959
GTWLGGLVALRLRLRAAPSDLAARRDVTLFSRLGYLAVALVLATGALNTAILVQDGGLLVVTSWTVVLAAKLCLVTVLLGLAVTNRVRITRSWQPSRLAGRVAIELAVGLLVLLAASILGRLPPPQP